MIPGFSSIWAGFAGRAVRVLKAGFRASLKGSMYRCYCRLQCGLGAEAVVDPVAREEVDKRLQLICHGFRGSVAVYQFNRSGIFSGGAGLRELLEPAPVLLLNLSEVWHRDLSVTRLSSGLDPAEGCLGVCADEHSELRG